ncbi:hypothetical protein SAMN06264364_1471 [Quadrisphaera granulorum]|uniref:Uncharacterized protein n=1 Tax=Quadrisphaera granulorum TaxID=317664 RepID=A0A315ZM80_9ACTN|nr:hypothetical protein [Quadrisphaera granulorum]PWJ46432.1 hypothetical protein BXY45_1471 [Quadrisphaera granulorum]SZE99056.1 hypothetical protein SAMN06264364_1471 [Quadrisphaera granulorum]
MALTVRLAQGVAGLTHLGAWTGDHIARVFVAAAAAEVGLADITATTVLGDRAVGFLQRVAGALPPLTAFLVSTGRWTGTMDDLADVRAVLDEVSPSAVQARALVEVLDRPEDPEAEAAAIAALPLTQHLVSLLRWTSRYLLDHPSDGVAGHRRRYD